MSSIGYDLRDETPMVHIDEQTRRRATLNAIHLTGYDPEEARPILEALGLVPPVEDGGQ